MTDVAVARPSSTVVLARDAAGTAEVLMVKRHDSSSFGGAYVFPGGVLDASDGAVTRHCRGMTAARADELLGIEGGINYFSAAIRELFEESGVLLADFAADDIDLDLARNRLNEGSLDWSNFVADNGLRLHCDALYYFSFWITPEVLPKRYSTRFFLAALPDGQTASHCGGELTDSCWVSAPKALESGRAGSMPMHFPTIKTLESLAQQESPEALLRWAESCAQAGVPCIFPQLGKREGESRVIVDGKDAGALE